VIQKKLDTPSYKPANWVIYWWTTTLNTRSHIVNSNMGHLACIPEVGAIYQWFTENFQNYVHICTRATPPVQLGAGQFITGLPACF